MQQQKEGIIIIIIRVSYKCCRNGLSNPSHDTCFYMSGANEKGGQVWRFFSIGTRVGCIYLIVFCFLPPGKYEDARPSLSRVYTAYNILNNNITGRTWDPAAGSWETNNTHTRPTEPTTRLSRSRAQWIQWSNSSTTLLAHVWSHLTSPPVKHTQAITASPPPLYPELLSVNNISVLCVYIFFPLTQPETLTWL